MSDDIVIRVKGLGKKYTIGGPQEKYHTIRDAIVNSVKAPFRRLTQQGTDQSRNEFWALKDVSFDVHKGEVIGIIGRNGAGKSTLLKILSRITTPTEGEVDIFGRVGSLLEVGTGFHPELTGRENIFLSGSILGMRKREIERKFDEIVKFSEIEKFIDTPVKRYSSGMYVRLAFAVAAHLEPEILLIDEVLAVGDAAFQKKCLGKMGDVAKEGRTVLFVSHNMGAITQICKRGIFLNSGNLLDIGEINAVVNKYILNSTLNSGQYWSTTEDPNKPLQVLEIYVIDANGKKSSLFDISDTIKIVIKHRCTKELIGAVVLVSIFSKGTELIHTFDSDAHADRLVKRQPGVYIDEIELPKRLFKAGIISISTTTAFIHKSTTIETNNDVISVLIDEIQEDTSFKGYAAIRSGLLSITPKWTNLNLNQI